MKFLLLSGSFHSQSRSLSILRAVEELLPGHTTVLPRLDILPYYNDDLTHEQPTSVNALVAQVIEADAIICCTPEYNHSIPAVLKNAIDWSSRPAFNSPLKGKPVTIITQAVSPVGGARAQAHLKLVFDSTLSDMHMSHEMMITGVNVALDAEGRLTDPRIRERLQLHLLDFVSFVARRQAASDAATISKAATT